MLIHLWWNLNDTDWKGIIQWSHKWFENQQMFEIQFHCKYSIEEHAYSSHKWLSHLKIVNLLTETWVMIGVPLTQPKTLSVVIFCRPINCITDICVTWKSTTFNTRLNLYISCNDIVNNLSSFSQWSTLLSACIANDHEEKKTIHSVIVSSLSFHCRMVF